jgi:hypothetical protein
MDLTIATPISFGISHSVNESNFTTKVSPTKRRDATKLVYEDKTREKKQYKKGFFKPTNKRNAIRAVETELVSGTTWTLKYKVGTSFQILKDDMTTKELKAFLLSNGTTARASQALTWIDDTLALADTHADKYDLYTAVDYNILELMTRINKSTIFDGTDIGEQAKQYINVLYADQIANNSAHTARVAFMENFDLSSDSKTWLADRGINFR